MYKRLAKSDGSHSKHDLLVAQAAFCAGARGIVRVLALGGTNYISSKCYERWGRPQSIWGSRRCRAVCRPWPKGRLPANSGHPSRTANFPHSGHWNALRGTEELRPNRTATLARKLQLPLNRLEARLLAQGVQKRVGLQSLQA